VVFYVHNEYMTQQVKLSHFEAECRTNNLRRGSQGGSTTISITFHAHCQEVTKFESAAAKSQAAYYTMGELKWHTTKALAAGGIVE